MLLMYIAFKFFFKKKRKILGENRLLVMKVHFNLKLIYENTETKSFWRVFIIFMIGFKIKFLEVPAREIRCLIFKILPMSRKIKKIRIIKILKEILRFILFFYFDNDLF